MKEIPQRYLRHIIIPEIGIVGLKRLKKSVVCVVGAGGIGSPAISYLAASGIGKIIIIESDKLELTNLNRQIIYKSKDIGKYKAFLAKKFINLLNPEVNVEVYNVYADYEKLLKIFKKADLILDCSDNFETRFNINQACIENKKSYVFAAVYRFEGQVAVFNPYKEACLGCVYRNLPETEESCADYGILGAVSGAIGSIAAIESIKVLLDLPSLINKMCILDFKDWNVSIINLKKNPECSYCSGKIKIRKENIKFFSCKSQKIKVNLSGRKIDSNDVLNLKLQQVKKFFMNYPRNTEISFYCEKGIKSSIAVDVLKSIGFTKVRKIDNL